MPTRAKGLIFLVVIGMLLLTYRHFVLTGAIRQGPILKTIMPIKVEEIKAQIITNSGAVVAAPMPTNTPSTLCLDGNTSHCLAGAKQEVEIWAWNANMGFLFAVGGATDAEGIRTSKGSLMEKTGVNVIVKRQDDSNVMQGDLIATAGLLASDPNAPGVKFVTIMGDGAAQFLAAVNPKLAKICPDCTAEVIASFGKSRGEDGFWGPKAWADDPKKALGGLSIAVLRDGDWNIQMKWQAQNDVPNNPEEGTYDPKAMNWINADSYTKAAEGFVSNTCVPLKLKGSIIGSKTVTKCVEAVDTWTPGDVTVATKRGGVVPIMTTRESAFQMPCVLVGLRRWDRAHAEEVTSMIDAALMGGAQIKSNPAALRRGGEISQALYKENGASADYWVKYFKGVEETDATGVRVKLGGSATDDLLDAVQMFGLSAGPNLFAATYTTFGKLVVQQYPNVVPSFPPVADILDTSYLKKVVARHTADPAKSPAPIADWQRDDAHIKNVEGRKPYHIQFASGSATVLPSSEADLKQLADDIMITKYVVALYGYTDTAKWAKATPEVSESMNRTLSSVRAQAVAHALKMYGVSNTIHSYGNGQDSPVADNSTEAGRAKNRRVEVILGTTN